MKNLNKTAALDEAIRLLEIRKAHELLDLKIQFKTTYESLKPIHLLKSGIKEMAATTGLKSDLVKITVGLAAGFLSKKLVVGSSHNPIKKLLGSVLQILVANVVVNK